MTQPHVAPELLGLNTTGCLLCCQRLPLPQSVFGPDVPIWKLEASGTGAEGGCHGCLACGAGPQARVVVSGGLAFGLSFPI